MKWVHERIYGLTISSILAATSSLRGMDDVRCTWTYLPAMDIGQWRQTIIFEVTVTLPHHQFYETIRWVRNLYKITSQVCVLHDQIGKVTKSTQKCFFGMAWSTQQRSVSNLYTVIWINAHFLSKPSHYISLYCYKNQCISWAECNILN